MNLDELRSSVADVETLGSGTEIGRDENGRIVYARHKDGTIMSYENSQLVGITKPNGTFMKYTDNKLDYIKDAQGNQLNYDENGKVIAVTDAEGNTISYKDDKVDVITDKSYRRAKFKDGDVDTMTDPAFPEKDGIRKIMEREDVKKTMKRNSENAVDKSRQIAAARMRGIAFNAEWLKLSLDRQAYKPAITLNKAAATRDGGR